MSGTEHYVERARECPSFNLWGGLEWNDDAGARRRIAYLVENRVPFIRALSGDIHLRHKTPATYWPWGGVLMRSWATAVS